MESLIFNQRRQQLSADLPENSAVIVAAAQEKTRNRDAGYPFRQDSDFFYLTGITEPDAVLLVLKNSEGVRSILFNLPKNLEMEIWTGIRMGQERVVAECGFDSAWPLDELDSNIVDYLNGVEHVYYSLDQEYLDKRLKSWLRKMRAMQRKGISAPQHFHDIGPAIHALRLIKSEHEIELMRRAAQISAEAHCLAMQACQPGMHEYQIESTIIGHFIQNGARQPAYESIVAGGENACVLHYTRNNDILQDGDLLLIDAGAEYGLYAADITRTFPVNGRFSSEQAAVYNIVLNAQLAAIEKVRPGARFMDYHDAAVKVIVAGLVSLGILDGDIDKLIAEEAYKPFYMHKTGHWLGMDVHDVGSYTAEGESRILESGMVLTVEPGLYFGAHLDSIDEKFRGIGIRIEDDVVVTHDGCDVLTSGVPKSIEAIERLMNGE